MPVDDFEVVRAALAALNAKDLDAYLSLCSDEFVLRSPLSALEGEYVGAAGVRSFFATLTEASASFVVEIDELLQVDPGRVLALLRLTASSHAGLELTQKIANVYEIADGKLRRVEVFTDRSAARASVATP
jgi:ketosteroid isomerase-like protein